MVLKKFHLANHNSCSDRDSQDGPQHQGLGEKQGLREDGTENSRYYINCSAGGGGVGGGGVGGGGAWHQAVDGGYHSKENTTEYSRANSGHHHCGQLDQVS